jgi:hypothetical protein
MTEFDASLFEPVTDEEYRSVFGQSAVQISPIEGTEKKKSPFTAEQTKDGARAVRMEDSAKVMADLEDSGFNFANAYDSLLIEYAPFIPDIMENYLHSTKYQLYQRAVQDYLQAQLRAETGAAITAQEFPMVFKRYVPLPGDTPEAIAAKRAARLRDAQTRRGQAGAAYGEARKFVKPEKPGGYTRTQEQALEELKERAKTDPELKAKLEMRGVTFDE